MQALTRELDLDQSQQQKVREILESQRAEVHRIWVDPAVLPAERAAVTQAETERTGEAIRSLLTDAQKLRYNRSRKGEPAAATDRRSVEEWMDAARSPRPAQGRSGQ